MKITTYYTTKGMLLFFSVMLLGFSVARSASYSGAERTEIIQTYKYVNTQDAVLEGIAKKFPDLASKSRNGKSRFHLSALGAGYQGVLKALDEITGGKGEEYMAPQNERLSKNVGKANFSRSYALKKIEQASELKVSNPEDFAVTITAEEVLSTLLRFNPKYQEEPSQEMHDDWTQLFSTRGEYKAKGLDFSLRFPSSWKPKTSDGPNTVREFYSQAGHGSVSCNILVRNVGERPSADEKRQLFTDEGVAQLAEQAGLERVIMAKAIKMGNQPAGLFIANAVFETVDVKIDMRMTRYFLMIDDKMVMIDFIESTPDGLPIHPEAKHQEHQTLFKIIASTFMHAGPFRNY
ncbi:MAG: hypothetical protein GVY36_17340 [Verrucomicrobia bacterium]|jgi:hypothetical protein|nr:hypothetical protein [Verrucomicrobiota bacterium]